MQDSRLIGREGELHTLLSWLQAGEQLRKRPPFQEHGFSREAALPHAMLLVGEAGIGKTRLAREIALLAGERGWEVAWASHDRTLPSNTPYRTWRDLLRAIKWSNRVPKLLRENHFTYRPLAAFLPELFGWLAWKERLEAEPAHIYEAVYHYLIEISWRRPLLLILEDLHQVDELSLNLLAYVVRKLRTEHVLILLTSRSGMSAGTPLWTLQRHLLTEHTLSKISIGPLTQEQLALLVPSAAGDRQQAWTQVLQRWSGGNPSFALDLLSLLEANC